MSEPRLALGALLLASAAFGALGGCGVIEPKPPGEQPSDERLDRPGVFSGESGTFIWRGGRRAEQAPDPAEMPEGGATSDP